MKATPSVWDTHAQWWRATFTNGADPEYETEILPLVAGMLGHAKRLVDIGCGEGQVARYLVSNGVAEEVLGVDPSANQLANAMLPALAPGERDGRHPGERDGTCPGERDGRHPGERDGRRPRDGKGRIVYLEGRAERLPLASSGFDAALCCLVIEHTEDPDAVLREAARVLEPGGRFLLVVNHPLFQGTGSGFIDDQILAERYWRVGPYLHEDVVVEEVDEGVLLPFAHRPLSRYLNPLAGLDLLLVEMAEPAPRRELLASSVDPELEAAIPRLLAMLFEHRPRLHPVSPRPEERATHEQEPMREAGRLG